MYPFYRLKTSVLYAAVCIVLLFNFALYVADNVTTPSSVVIVNRKCRALRGFFRIISDLEIAALGEITIMELRRPSSYTIWGGGGVLTQKNPKKNQSLHQNR